MNVTQLELEPDERAIVRYVKKSKYIYAEAMIHDIDSGEISWNSAVTGVYCTGSFARWEPAHLRDYLEGRAEVALPLLTDPLGQIRYVGGLQFRESWLGSGWLVLWEEGDLADALDDMRWWIQVGKADKVTPDAFEALWWKCSPQKYEIVPAPPGEKTVWEELELRMLDAECTRAANEAQRARDAMEAAVLNLRWRRDEIRCAKRAELKAARHKQAEVRKRRNKKVFRVPEFIQRVGQATRLTQHINTTT